MARVRRDGTSRPTWAVNSMLNGDCVSERVRRDGTSRPTWTGWAVNSLLNGVCVSERVRTARSAVPTVRAEWGHPCVRKPTGMGCWTAGRTNEDICPYPCRADSCAPGTGAPPKRGGPGAGPSHARRGPARNPIVRSRCRRTGGRCAPKSNSPPVNTRNSVSAQQAVLRVLRVLQFRLTP